MTKPRTRRPKTLSPAPALTEETRPRMSPEERGTHRQRYQLEREILRRLKALHLRRMGLSMKRAPGLSTGGSEGSTDEPKD